jgi:hypothetical protein
MMGTRILLGVAQWLLVCLPIVQMLLPIVQMLLGVQAYPAAVVLSTTWYSSLHSLASVYSRHVVVSMVLPNNRFEFALGARPTRKGDAPLLAAQAMKLNYNKDTAHDFQRHR